MTQAYAATDFTDRGQLNSVQLNVVTLVDMERAAATKSLEGCLYMMDNSVGGVGQGSDHLETICKQGQVINWIIRPIDMHRGADGTWPPMPKINTPARICCGPAVASPRRGRPVLIPANTSRRARP
ncbi:hypothetical protein, partial [Streptosporangium sp. NPDC048865]|uniref:hypothetical protein n=1 Tax=Streptosporangium sp. NPDC048865 TaxID=3155766 RepID=UPI0034240EDD